MTAQEIRSSFLEFFNSKSHTFISSSPLVVKDDPTLMFINAGMNQFKDLFLGNAEVKHPRVYNSQKCLRVSGKHNDLEEVGVDTYHHTMFEMLGNWSFGDYFKVEAIEWAWEFLTEVCKVDKESLYVTVFEGADDDGLALDTEAYDLWKKIIPEERILMGNKKDNFWEMGKTGPCGPCSEIHVDIRDASEKAKIPGKDLVNQDHPQVIEVWNLVFMEYNRLKDNSLVKLPAQHVDTGMGFERLAMVLQKKQSNYDTDVFTPLIKVVEKISGVKYGSALDTDIAIRVIVDHVRAVAFAIADGQMPSNTGAGYVIRRILRRAIRYGFSKLNISKPFIFELVDTLADEMGAFFPEIISQKSITKKVIKEEESNFLRTLDKGIDRYQSYKTSENKVITGAAAFELYDTFGFPIDLTELLAREDGWTVDMKEFKSELNKQKDRSRNAATLETDDWVIVNEGEGKFIGYDHLVSETQILRYRKVSTKGKDLFQVELLSSPFYPEGGGQVGDKGVLLSGTEKHKVIDTKKENGLNLLTLTTLPSDPRKNVTAQVFEDLRADTAGNHSATHLLHLALRNVLGTHVEQKGSLVNNDYLRFDFSHFQKITPEELQEIEKQVRTQIRANYPLHENRAMDIEDAKAKGAMALFGEKYGDKVRMIQFGDSVELCGGIHVNSTSEIGSFIITSESAVAAGVRRIEAITGKAAEAHISAEFDLLNEVRKSLKNPKDLLKQIGDLQTQNSTLQKEVEQLIKEKAVSIKASLINSIQEINGATFIAQKIDLDSADAIKDMSFQLKNQYPNLFMVIGAEVNGKPNLSITVGDELIASKDLNAGKIIRELAKEINGGGGGQPFFATAGGKKIEGLDSAIEKAISYLS